ncbi:MAG: single-stranded-DNA-specific exonuclease RecJ [Wenzhouxiangella sp.]
MRQVQLQRLQPATSLPRGLHPVVARVLANRGLSEPPDYRLNRLLPPTLSGLEAASELLAEAIVHGQRILVVGDFDADGATGVALAVRALRAMGACSVDWRVPDRFRHGYGLSEQLVEELTRPLPDLLVTVDQGVSSHAGVQRARQQGMRVLITDHHLPGETLPDAHAIINPNLSGDPFPSPNLAGVGVMFYTLMAVRARLRALGWFGQRQEPRLDHFLDLVALGTVADLVPLDANNRLLVFQGLERIRAGRCAPGLRALLEVAGRRLPDVQAADLGFAAAPRLNAAGRLDDMSIGIRCLLADSEQEAASLADRLHQLNGERQSIQAAMQEEAEAQIDSLLTSLDPDVPAVCVQDPSWHPGVVGLVAGRLMERLQRPVIAFAPAEAGSEELKGSARSTAGIHIRDLLVSIDAAQPGLIRRFGGHARAAGLSLEARHFQAFGEQLQTQAARFPRHSERVDSDGPLASSELTVETAAQLQAAGPWGQAWPEPLFDGRFRVLERRVVGQVHLKMTVQPEDGGAPVDAIAFRAGDWCYRDLPDWLHLTYRLEINRWRGSTQLQLNIQHLVEPS